MVFVVLQGYQAPQIPSQFLLYQTGNECYSNDSEWASADHNLEVVIRTISITWMWVYVEYLFEVFEAPQAFCLEVTCLVF
jgi:hypothetical protein